MPLTFDMPLEKLKVYQGRTPRPDDFDTFWDNSLAEVRAIDPQVELTPAEFHADFAECLDMYFTGVGGARVHAKLLRPTFPQHKRRPTNEGGRSGAQPGGCHPCVAADVAQRVRRVIRSRHI